eukprot:Mrub_02352.p2 GENE.Mrub_02352~~Mrub_02352.p2  ORF type:complete len:307 (-),score=25.09 Mrub_02352:233-1153(-)
MQVRLTAQKYGVATASEYVYHTSITFLVFSGSLGLFYLNSLPSVCPVSSNSAFTSISSLNPSNSISTSAFSTFKSSFYYDASGNKFYTSGCSLKPIYNTGVITKNKTIAIHSNVYITPYLLIKCIINTGNTPTMNMNCILPLIPVTMPLLAIHHYLAAVEPSNIIHPCPVNRMTNYHRYRDSGLDTYCRQYQLRPRKRDTNVAEARRPTSSMTSPAYDMSIADVNVPSKYRVDSDVLDMPSLSRIDWLVTPMHTDWPGDEVTRHSADRKKMMYPYCSLFEIWVGIEPVNRDFIDSEMLVCLVSDIN